MNQLFDIVLLVVFPFHKELEATKRVNSAPLNPSQFPW